MDSSELYHVKQQFILGAFKALIDISPAPTDTPTFIYQARSYIALNDPASAQKILPADSDNVAVKAVLALATYVQSPDNEASLEALRDLAVEIEGDDAEVEERDKELVRVLAGTAFARAGEIEEALETLGAGTDAENLEAVAVLVQIYLSINRPDLAKKEFDRSKRWAEDDLLLQLIESTIGIVTGKDNYANSSSFYTEQLGNPSLSSPHLLTARGITRVLRGEISEAKSDLEDSIQQQPGDAETLAALVVAAGLGGGKPSDVADVWSQLQTAHPTHPLVLDVEQKSAQFDDFAAKWEVPAVAAA